MKKSVTIHPAPVVGETEPYKKNSPSFFKEITKGFQQNKKIQAYAEKSLPRALKIGAAFCNY